MAEGRSTEALSRESIKLMAVEFAALQSAGSSLTDLFRRLTALERQMIAAKRQQELGATLYVLLDAVDVASSPLPHGWEKRRQKDGRPYFANHSTKSSSWDDPRAKAETASKHSAVGGTAERICVGESLAPSVSSMPSSASTLLKGEVMTLNVGGTMFSTFKHTLLPTGKPPSLFNRMLLGGARDFATDAVGNIFLDREPSLFRYILQFLRSGICKFDGRLDSEMRTEVAFFGLDLEVMKPTDARQALKEFDQKCRACGFRQNVFVASGEKPTGRHKCSAASFVMYSDAQIVAHKRDFSPSKAYASGYSFIKDVDSWIPTELLTDSPSTLFWRTRY